MYDLRFLFHNFHNGYPSRKPVLASSAGGTRHYQAAWCFKAFSDYHLDLLTCAAPVLTDLYFLLQLIVFSSTYRVVFITTGMPQTCIHVGP